jgi:hypothetical protein
LPYRSAAFFKKSENLKEGFSIYEINNDSNKLFISIFDRVRRATGYNVGSNQYIISHVDFYLGGTIIPLPQLLKNPK